MLLLLLLSVMHAITVDSQVSAACGSHCAWIYSRYCMCNIVGSRRLVCFTFAFYSICRNILMGRHCGKCAESAN